MRAGWRVYARGCNLSAAQPGAAELERGQPARLAIVGAGQPADRYIAIGGGQRKRVGAFVGKIFDHHWAGVVRPGDPYSLVSAPCVVGGSPFAWRTPVSAGIPQYVDWFKKTCS